MEMGNEQLTPGKLIKVLLVPDNNMQTAWQFAADWSIEEALERLWEWAKLVLNRDELNKKLVLAKDEGENTVLNYS